MEFSQRYGLGDDRKQFQSSKLEIKERKLTDKFCLILFLILIVLFTALSIQNIRSSQFRAILSPVDSEGTLCGQKIGTINAEDFKYLYLDYPEKGESALSKRVCVEECPTSSSISVKCLPNSAVPSCEALKVHQTIKVAGRLCIPTDLSFYKDISNKLYGIDSSVIFDSFIINHRLMMLSAVLAFFIALIYGKFLSKCAFVVVLSTFIGAYACLGYFGYIINLKKSTLMEESIDSSDSEKMKKAASTYKMGAYFIWALTAGLSLITLLLLKRIRETIAVLQNAGSFMTQNKSILLVPLIALIVGATVSIGWGISTLAFISRNKIDSSENSTFGQINLQSQSW
jgi:choline transporter-like protein 2/4/5